MRLTDEPYAGSSACAPPRSAASPVQRCRARQSATARLRAAPVTGTGRPSVGEILAGVHDFRTAPPASSVTDRTPVRDWRAWYQTKLPSP